MKSINDTMVNQTHYLPTFNAFRQPTAPPRNPENEFSYQQIKDTLLIQGAHNN
jgi:hypothetical protein